MTPTVWAHLTTNFTHPHLSCDGRCTKGMTDIRRCQLPVLSKSNFNQNLHRFSSSSRFQHQPCNISTSTADAPATGHHSYTRTEIGQGHYTWTQPSIGVLTDHFTIKLCWHHRTKKDRLNPSTFKHPSPLQNCVDTTATKASNRTKGGRHSAKMWCTTSAVQFQANRLTRTVECPRNTIHSFTPCLPLKESSTQAFFAQGNSGSEQII